MIDKDFKSLVSFEVERDAFVAASMAGIQRLVKLVENANEPAFLAMTKRPWGSLPSVGDQSEHITQFALVLKPMILLLKQVFTGGKFFKTFCDKFVESIGLT